MVPTGTFSTTLPPSRPVQFEPSPCRPRSAVYSGLKRKWTRGLWRSLDSITTSPPRPPSPPEGPPRGTNFSRRKAMQPLPPPPALMRMIASSMNISTFRLYNPMQDAYQIRGLRRSAIADSNFAQRRSHPPVILSGAPRFCFTNSDHSRGVERSRQSVFCHVASRHSPCAFSCERLDTTFHTTIILGISPLLSLPLRGILRRPSR